MNLRIICFEADVAPVACGNADRPDQRYRSFDVVASPELAEWLTEPIGSYDHRVIIGVEILPSQSHHTDQVSSDGEHDRIYAELVALAEGWKAQAASAADSYYADDYATRLLAALDHVVPVKGKE